MSARKTNTNHVGVIGVGASAGGLEAFKSFLTGVSKGVDFAIVLIQHLDPDHDSLMPELLRSKTDVPVHSIEDGMTIEPGNIYIMPSGRELEIDGDTLRLVEFRSPRGLRRPIDRFFNSLAEARNENAIAIVLSGTGSDGTNGTREVKGRGGLVLVQDPSEAQYDGMPRSLIDQHLADVIVEAAEIMDVVGDYFELRVNDDENESDDSDEEKLLSRIVRQVKFRTGHDFSEYKKATIRRRIAVRMSARNLKTLSDYLRYLAENKSEADRLFQDLLINVTSFFRDKEHFDTLKTSVLPSLVKQCEDGEDLRVWVAGCSTGEEAYTVGILLAEEVKRVKARVNITIFGTDIDEAALSIARAGRYQDAIANDIPEDFLNRYFKPLQNGFEIGPELREMVRFSRHSFIKDPPFSRVDLICCRNVLIYMRETLQEVASRVFHYSLREGGYLFLGPSESPSMLDRYFTETSSRGRIYERRPGPAKPLSLGQLSGAIRKRRSFETEGATQSFSELSELEREVVENFAPPYLHADAENKLLYASPNATKYLSFRPGAVSTDVFDIITPELEQTLRSVARQKVEDGETHEFEFQGKIKDQDQRVIVSLRQLPDGSRLIVLDDKLKLLDARPSGSSDLGEKHHAYVRQLEIDLDQARQEVRTTVEELETSNEELKSSNEEMMSMNEELQSANEELTTINDELQAKLRELNQLNVDLDNFIASARVPTVFLNADMEVLRFTIEATDYFSVTKADIGRPLGDLNSRIDDKDVLELCRKTVVDQREREAEFMTDDGETAISVRIMPFSPDGEEKRGVVFTMQDVSELREAITIAQNIREEAEAQSEEVNQIYSTSYTAMGLIDRDMRYRRVNKKLADINGVPIEAHIGRTIRDVIPGVADHTEQLVTKVFETGEPIIGERITGKTIVDPNKIHIWESDWVPYLINGEIAAVAVNVREITEQVQTSEKLRQILHELEHRVKNMLSNVKALVNRAARDSTADREVFQTLNRRIEGLSQTHSLLTAEKWSSAPLSSIIRLETAAIYGDDRVSLSGPNVRVTSEATLSIGMAVHELATNATKYGALSNDDGRIDVTWSRITDANGDRMLIEWRESGGPEAKAPDEAGFGSRLINMTIEGNLEGQVRTYWEPTGIRVVMEMEYEVVAAPEAR